MDAEKIYNELLKIVYSTGMSNAEFEKRFKDTLTKELQEAREEIRKKDHEYKQLEDHCVEMKQREMSAYAERNEAREDEELCREKIEQLQKEIAELKYDRDSYKESFENCQSSLQSEKEENKRLREGMADIKSRLEIIKEWLNPDPFTDVEAALSGIDQLLSEERKGECHNGFYFGVGNYGECPECGKK